MRRPRTVNVVSYEEPEASESPTSPPLELHQHTTYIGGGPHRSRRSRVSRSVLSVPSTPKLSTEIQDDEPFNEQPEELDHLCRGSEEDEGFTSQFPFPWMDPTFKHQLKDITDEPAKRARTLASVCWILITLSICMLTKPCRKTLFLLGWMTGMYFSRSLFGLRVVATLRVVRYVIHASRVAHLPTIDVKDAKTWLYTVEVALLHYIGEHLSIASRYDSYFISDLAPGIIIPFI